SHSIRHSTRYRGWLRRRRLLSSALILETRRDFVLMSICYTYQRVMVMDCRTPGYTSIGNCSINTARKEPHDWWSGMVATGCRFTARTWLRLWSKYLLLRSKRGH